MHSQLINTLRDGSHRHHTCSCLLSLALFSQGWIALNWAAIQRIWPHRWCQIMQIVSLRAIHKHCRPRPPISRAVAQPRSDVVPSSAVPQVFLPPPGHHRLDCCGTRRKISVKGPIRQTWPNKHRSCCQLDDSSLQLSLQVALNFIRSIRTSVREKEAFPHSRNPIHVNPMGMTISFC